MTVADERAVAEVSQRFRRWLHHQARWPETLVDPLLVAVGEAVRNVVEHAYPSAGDGVVAVSAVVAVQERRRRIVIVVSDQGMWQDTGLRRGRRDKPHYPQGLRRIRQLTQSLEVRRGRYGTKVLMASHPAEIDS